MHSWRLVLLLPSNETREGQIRKPNYIPRDNSSDSLVAVFVAPGLEKRSHRRRRAQTALTPPSWGWLVSLEDTYWLLNLGKSILLFHEPRCEDPPSGYVLKLLST